VPAAGVGPSVAVGWAGALLDHRRRAIVLPATAAVVLTGFQAYLGKITVETYDPVTDSVRAHEVIVKPSKGSQRVRLDD